jgi:hypothetical protein
MKMNLPTIKNIMPSIRGLNLWTAMQKIKDNTIQRTSTIQLYQKIGIYSLIESDRAILLTLNAKEQQMFLKTHGKLERTTGNMKSHSFVLQFSQIFFDHLMSRAYNGFSTNPIDVLGVGGIIDTSNASYALVPNPAYGLQALPAANAPAATTTYGILVGTGTTTPASADYKMQTLVLHGSTSGKLQYQATAVGAAGIVGANVDTVIARVLVNGSGGSITLKEVGLAVSIADDSILQRYFLIAHDAVNQAIANTEVALVSYDFRTTV